MAEGLAAAVANDILDALCTNGSLSTLPVATIFVQLHTAAPGASGTTAVAGNATRKQVTFGTASSGAVSNPAAVSWSTSEVDTSEVYSHWTAWTASTSGTFLASGVVTANAVTTGDEFTIPIGDLDLTFNIAS